MGFRRMYLSTFRFWESMPRILRIPREHNARLSQH
ncbi:hypothetical protein HID58_055670 [Brassica napus]|uniref:Uncharacterized protein n=1 Tax=Brassica napus TaxID=3708 RepID=A0ABQ8AMA8_BRANA|nr:hypothetical protein HID58_055670 [Brassica napus]